MGVYSHDVHNMYTHLECDPVECGAFRAHAYESGSRDIAKDSTNNYSDSCVHIPTCSL